MICIEKTNVFGFDAAIRGMRNPLNSWEKTDSFVCDNNTDGNLCHTCRFLVDAENFICNRPECGYIIGENDLKLMKKLVSAGSDHRKFMRFITVTCDVTAPLYWWKEYDTYKVGTVANSCSTMHKIHAKEFTMDDFSTDHLLAQSIEYMRGTIEILNEYRKAFIETGDKDYWWQLIELLPTSYNQKRTLILNYEVLRNMYHARKNHKLDEWHMFCEWIETLPYSELITEVN